MTQCHVIRIVRGSDVWVAMQLSMSHKLEKLFENGAFQRELLQTRVGIAR